MGCDFATLSCMELMEKEVGEKKSPFCSVVMDTTPMTFCTHDRFSSLY